MSNLSRRPISIWITQILLLLAGLPFSIVAIVATLRDLMWIVSGQLTEISLLWLTFSPLFRSNPNEVI